jgi:hypothetical protein
VVQGPKSSISRKLDYPRWGRFVRHIPNKLTKSDCVTKFEDFLSIPKRSVNLWWPLWAKPTFTCEFVATCARAWKALSNDMDKELSHIFSRVQKSESTFERYQTKLNELHTKNPDQFCVIILLYLPHILKYVVKYSSLGNF